ncbi:MAG: hypothetical protein LQ344_007161 [Seirophora lacunosa]|nr:MAG: hypothetical protein LQ344_007161 [Seirophora lacunosa]
MSQYPSQSFPASSTPALSDEEFTQSLLQFLSEAHEDFPLRTEPAAQSTQQWALSSYPPVENALDQQFQPGQLITDYRAPPQYQTAPLAQNVDNDYPDLYQQNQAGPSYDNSLGTVNPTVTISSPTEQTNAGAVEANEQKPESNGAAKRAMPKVDEHTKGSRTKAKIETIDGQLHVEYRSKMVKAVYHSEVREEMLAKAPPHLYAQAPARGRSDSDQTSFWPSHRTWEFDDREGRPEILFQFLPAYDTATRLPGPMKLSDGRMVLDSDGKFVRDWPMPACLSSEVEGGRLEAMARENGNRISKRDFTARMPPQSLGAHGKSKGPVTETAIGMRRIRYRTRAGLLSFQPREGSLEKKKALVQCIPKDIMAQILTSNSLRCWRDNNDQEIAYISKASEGKHFAKAGPRRLPDDVRADRKVPKDMKLLDFKLPNPEAWPYVKGIEDDDAAIGLALASLGSSPAASGGKKRQRDESPESAESNTEAGRPQNKRRRSAGDEGAEALKPGTNVTCATSRSTNFEPFPLLNSPFSPTQYSVGLHDYPSASGAAPHYPAEMSNTRATVKAVAEATPSQPSLGQAADWMPQEANLAGDTQDATRKSIDYLFSPEPAGQLGLAQQPFPGTDLEDWSGFGQPWGAAMVGENLSVGGYPLPQDTASGDANTAG